MIEVLAFLMTYSNVTKESTIRINTTEFACK